MLILVLSLNCFFFRLDVMSFRGDHCHHHSLYNHCLHSLLLCLYILWLSGHVIILNEPLN